MRRLRAARSALLAFSLTAAVCATGWGQTLERAESLWRQGNYRDANDTFRALVAAYPNNPDYRVRWGRLFLERFQPVDAAKLFEEALAIKKDHTGALIGLAEVAADQYEKRAVELAEKALAIDPKLVRAHELLARLALEDNNPQKAAEQARMIPNSVEAKAILATIEWLNDRPAEDPRNAEAYTTAGYFFVLNRRYEEGIGYYRKAVALDPKLWRAHSQLGVNLMRLGEDEEARRELELCYEAGYRDPATVNTLRLLDSYKNFVTIKTGNAVLKLQKKEAGVLKPYIEQELQRAIATYEEKYGFKLERPVQLEVYPDHEDFAVRTMGMPGLGALGVTFGYVVAMDSPSARKPGTFHWAGTLWHEMSHVYVLSATHHRVPRWFTEGMAVYEETAASPDWGDPTDEIIVKAVKEKRLLPVADLDRGFVRPSYPAQVSVSYYQAGQICGYIVRQWGFGKLLAMMRDFATLATTPQVIEKQLGMKPEEFDRRFLAALEANPPKVEKVDRTPATLKRLAAEAEQAGRKQEAIDTLERLIYVYPIDEELHQRLGALYAAGGNWTGAVREYRALVAMNPVDPAASHFQLAQALRSANQVEEARDELLLALEAAPGYRPAQKLLLELSRK